MWTFVIEIFSRVPSLGGTMLPLGRFSLQDYLSGKIVMLSPNQCLIFKMCLKALSVWAARGLLKVSQYFPLFISYIHLLLITSLPIDSCSLYSALKIKSAKSLCQISLMREP